MEVMMQTIHLKAGNYKIIVEDSERYGLGMNSLEQLGNILTSQDVNMLSAKMTKIEMTADDGHILLPEHSFDFISYYKDDKEPLTQDFLGVIADIMYACNLHTFIAVAYGCMEVDETPDVILEKEIVFGDDMNEDQINEKIEQMKKEIEEDRKEKEMIANFPKLKTTKDE
jgi:hypothetical protein